MSYIGSTYSMSINATVYHIWTIRSQYATGCICTLVYSDLNTQSNTLQPTRLPYALERILWCAVRDEFPKASSKGLGTRLRMLHNNKCL